MEKICNFIYALKTYRIWFNCFSNEWATQSDKPSDCLENLKKDKKGITGFNNVYFEKGRFRARFCFKGKLYCLGYFDNAEIAKNTVDFVYKKLLNNENIDEYITSNKNKYHKNISIDKGKYRPRFVVNKKRINLPAFEKLEDAINCLNEAKKSYSN